MYTKYITTHVTENDNGDKKYIIEFFHNPKWIEWKKSIERNKEIEQSVKSGKPIQKIVQLNLKSKLWDSLATNIKG